METRRPLWIFLSRRAAITQASEVNVTGKLYLLIYFPPRTALSVSRLSALASGTTDYQSVIRVYPYNHRTLGIDLNNSVFLQFFPWSHLLCVTFVLNMISHKNTAYCLPVSLIVFWGAEAVEKQFMCKWKLVLTQPSNLLHDKVEGQKSNPIARYKLAYKSKSALEFLYFRHLLSTPGKNGCL